MSTTINKRVDRVIQAQGDTALSSVVKVLGGYEAGYKLVEGVDPDAIERFVVLRVRGRPRLLLPPARPLMQTAIMSFLGSRRFASFVPLFVQAATRTSGLLPFVKSAEVSLVSRQATASPLRILLSDVLGRNDFQIALRLSFGRPNAKTVAMAVSDAGEALCFAKFGSESMTNDLVAHESAMLEQFEDVDDLPIVMPRRLHSGIWAGSHDVLITAPLVLEPLKRDATCAHLAADEFTSRYLVGRSALRDSSYWRRTRDCVENLDITSDSVDSINSSVRRIEDAWGDELFDFGASHGDWTRANLGMLNGKLAALDWERCTKVAPRGVDIAHFAIAENSSFSLNRSLDIEHVANNVQQYLRSIDRDDGNAKILVILALLEMVIRFKSAQNVGLQSADLKFGSALQTGLEKWAK